MSGLLKMDSGAVPSSGSSSLIADGRPMLETATPPFPFEEGDDSPGMSHGK